MLITALALLSISATSQGNLGRNAVISLVTYDPSETAVYALYGHTAIRVKDTIAGTDYVFNYGIFDFSRPGFIYRFTKGETDYKLGVVEFRHLIAECTYRECGVREQILNLSDEEKSRIWETLIWNAKPENATYRYNFFFDNCATRPVAIIEKSISGKIVYADSNEQHTFRELINNCMRNNPWLIFGTEIALGSPADRIATQQEEFFLPLCLEAAFAKATIVNPDGSERKLIVQTNVLLDSVPDKRIKGGVTPFQCMWAILTIVLLLAIWEWKGGNLRWMDCVIFCTTGLAGCLVFFLAFVSVHPATWPNWLILWLHPFHLVGAILIASKNWKKNTKIYHCANIILLSALLIGSPFIPQQFNSAFFPLIILLLFRSAINLMRRRLEKKLLPHS